MTKPLLDVVRPAGFPSARSGQAHFATRECVTEGLELQNEMVRPAGFEPATYGFVVRYSVQLSYGRTN